MRGDFALWKILAIHYDALSRRDRFYIFFLVLSLMRFRWMMDHCRRRRMRNRGGLELWEPQGRDELRDLCRDCGFVEGWRLLSSTFLYV
jgi:hypothetical protein